LNSTKRWYGLVCVAPTTRAQLGEEAFAAAWEAGRAMTLEQAIEEALGQ